MILSCIFSISLGVCVFCGGTAITSVLSEDISVFYFGHQLLMI